MATLDDCRAAVRSLTEALDDVDPALRERHVPRRTVACRVTDLDLTFYGRLDEHGLHDLVEHSDDGEVDADVQLAMSSDELVALSQGEDDFLHGWLRGRIQVSASVRDLLRLRSLLGV
jgi:hypothetical protein